MELTKAHQVFYQWTQHGILAGHQSLAPPSPVDFMRVPLSLVGFCQTVEDSTVRKSYVAFCLCFCLLVCAWHDQHVITHLATH